MVTITLFFISMAIICICIIQYRSILSGLSLSFKSIPQDDLFTGMEAREVKTLLHNKINSNPIISIGQENVKKVHLFYRFRNLSFKNSLELYFDNLYKRHNREGITSPSYNLKKSKAHGVIKEMKMIWINQFYKGRCFHTQNNLSIFSYFEVLFPYILFSQKVHYHTWKKEIILQVILLSIKNYGRSTLWQT